MKPIKHYLDECIDRKLAKNDADIARQCGVHRSAVNQWRAGTTAPGDDAAAKLADMLGKLEVIAECGAARAKTENGRRIHEKLARIAAAAVIVMGISTHESHAMSISGVHTGHYGFQKW